PNAEQSGSQGDAALKRCPITENRQAGEEQLLRKLVVHHVGQEQKAEHRL
ncbi:hypothetical protein ISS22_16090, partial [candidate division KSB1 bacterium]|nr:hypothetical protein [candidate division KSB1 bacterium]